MARQPPNAVCRRGGILLGTGTRKNRPGRGRGKKRRFLDNRAAVVENLGGEAVIWKQTSAEGTRFISKEGG